MTMRRTFVGKVCRFQSREVCQAAGGHIFAAAEPVVPGQLRVHVSNPGGRRSSPRTYTDLRRPLPTAAVLHACSGAVFGDVQLSR
eukprot:365707-Chlamydomonas_euryale.AAC.33